MADNQKFNAPDGPPPTYNKPVHHDAGPYYGSPGSPAPYGDPHAAQYGSPPPQGQWNQQQYGPPQGGYYQPQQQGGMYYQQPPQGYGPQQGPPNGYYGSRRSGAGDGICAGLLAALACCCCLDFLF